MTYLKSTLDKRARIFLVGVFISAHLASFSQVPSIEWQKSLGGSSPDIANSVQQTSDGGFIVAGFSESNDGDVSGNHGGQDFWIVKLDVQGNIGWLKSFGGTLNEQALSVAEAMDKGFLIAGTSNSNDGDISGHHGDWDYWILRVDSAGNLLWQKSFGGNNYDRATSIQPTSDGGCCIAGYTRSNDGDVTGWHQGQDDFGQPSADYWIVKLDAQGNLVWQRTLGGSMNDFAYSIQQTSDQGYIIAGTSFSSDGDISESHFGSDVWVVKLDSYDNIIWQKCYGGSSYEGATSIELTKEGGFIVGGGSEVVDGDITESHGATDYWILNLDSSGNLLWQKSLGGSYGDILYSIQETIDGGYCIAGWTNSNDGDVLGWHDGFNDFGDPKNDYWIVKVDVNGSLQWQRTLGGSNWEEGHSIQQTSDQGFIVAGYSVSNDGDVSGNQGNGDYWIVKLSADITSISNQSFNSLLNIYPNPSTGIFQIQNQQPNIENVTAFNLLGEKVFSTANFKSQTSNSIDLTSQPNGVYFLHMETAAGLVVKKVVISH